MKETKAEARARRYAEPKSPDDPRHGKVSFYNNHGCRCERCTNARRVAAREDQPLRRRSRAKDNPADPRHGTEYFYKAYGCRCDRCRTKAKREQLRRERKQ